MSTEKRKHMWTEENFCDRFTALLDSLGWDSVDFVEKSGVNKSTVSMWKNGHREPRGKSLRMIAEVTGCNLAWLSSGSGKMFGSHDIDQNVSPAPQPRKEARRIPVISWVAAGGFADVSDPYQPGHAEEWIKSAETLSENSFALVVEGDSMEPEFTAGDIITVDPGRAPNNGSYVVAKNGERATFKQLVVDGGNVYLKPLNSRFPVIDMTGKELRIVGVVVEKRKNYR